MDDRDSDRPLGEEGRMDRIAGDPKRVPMSTDWHWLYLLRTADLDSDFMEAVAERVDDQERPPLEILFA